MWVIDIESSSLVNFDELTLAYEQLQKLAIDHAIHIVVGTIMQENDKFYNSAVVFVPYQEKEIYHKRALWGWDRAHTDLNIIMFYDVSDFNDIERYETIKAHIRRRRLHSMINLVVY